jgi:hypothetical protein
MTDRDDVPRLHDDGLPAAAAADLDARLAALATELPPPEDGWAEVAGRLEPREAPRRRPWRGFALAASVATLAVTLGLTLLRTTGPLAPTTVAEAPAPAATTTPAATLPASDRFMTASLPDALGGRAALGAGFIEARNDVAGSFVERLESLDPATREVVERNLAVIHDALGRIEGALADDPHNELLRDLLTSTWQREMDYMNRVRRLPSASERRIEL